MMRCRRSRQRLGPYLEGDLGSAERARVEAHLDRCTSCRDELRALRETLTLLHGLQDVDPPLHLAQRVIARLRDGEGGAGWWDRIVEVLDSRALRAAGLGAVAGALLAGVLLQPQAQDPRAQADALRAALRQAPAPTPDLELGPRFGAAATPEVPEPDALLEAALLDPAAAVRAWRSAPPEARELYASRLARRARERGEAAALAAEFRSLGADADALAGRLEAPAPAPPADAF